VVGWPAELSRYPLIIRSLPATSATGVFQTFFEFHNAVAVVSAPVSSTSFSADALLAPGALFQFDLGTAPAISEAAMAVVLLPLKSILMAPKARGMEIEDPQARTVAVKSHLRQSDENFIDSYISHVGTRTNTSPKISLSGATYVGCLIRGNSNRARFGFHSSLGRIRFPAKRLAGAEVSPLVPGDGCNVMGENLGVAR
jgi:hypothetical protein